MVAAALRALKGMIDLVFKPGENRATREETERIRTELAGKTTVTHKTRDGQVQVITRAPDKQ